MAVDEKSEILQFKFVTYSWSHMTSVPTCRNNSQLCNVQVSNNNLDNTDSFNSDSYANKRGATAREYEKLYNMQCV